MLLVAWVGGVLGFFEGVWFGLLCFFARTADQHEVIQSLLGSLDLAHTESSEKPYTILGTIPIKLADIHE